MSEKYYFDFNATTPVSVLILNRAQELLENWGNPSSIHWASRQPKNILRDVRNKIAQELSIHPLEIIFTSGASESNNTIIRGIFEYVNQADANDLYNLNDKDHFICSEVEHPSVFKTMKHLQDNGAKVDFIPVNRQGELDLKFLKEKISEKTALVSVMLANNETGTIFPIAEVVQIAKSKGALIHTDAVQAFGKIPLSLKELGVDYASFSGHKIYSVKGTGFLYSKKGAPLFPLIYGGGQERHRRGGTENTFGIACLGIAVEALKNNLSRSGEIKTLRDYLEEKLLKISGVHITAAQAQRLGNTSSLVIDGVDGETLLMSLDLRGFAVSTGAACSSGNPEPSPVLLAMGLSREEAQSSLRLSLGVGTTKEQVDLLIQNLKQVIEHLRKIKNEELQKVKN